jgi:4-hydroxybenzoate polyprenyltransferase
VLLAAGASGWNFPLLLIPAVLAGQLSVGWSNDAFDADRDAAAGRTDKPIVTGGIGRRPVVIAAGVALVVSIALSLAIGLLTTAVNVVMIAAAWAYNAGLKSTPASVLMYIAGFGPIPALAASTLPGHPAPQAWTVVVASLLGVGAHFANVLPDLAADRISGVRGLPQLIAARRGGETAVRAIALVLLLAATVMMVLAPPGPPRWPALLGLAVAVALAVVGARGSGRVPFLAAMGIAFVDVVLFVTAGAALV